MSFHEGFHPVQVRLVEVIGRGALKRLHDVVQVEGAALDQVLVALFRPGAGLSLPSIHMFF